MSTFSQSQPFAWSIATRWIAIALGLYVLYATSRLDVSWQRLLDGADAGGRFIGRMFPPDLSKMGILWKGILESMQIALLASALGIALALPVSLLSARNFMPAAMAALGRALISFCRSLHPVIMAILFVKAVGFGALAGILALMVATIGFVGKLFADAIEEVSSKQVEAVRATGAPFMSVIIYGVLPQVTSRFVGFATYQLDSNLRNSTMVGIVGAGGIGGALFSAFQRFDFDFVFTILATIVAIIVAGELTVNAIRKALRV
jgi:phosphonate transport system permease protein